MRFEILVLREAADFAFFTVRLRTGFGSTLPKSIPKTSANFDASNTRRQGCHIPGRANTQIELLRAIGSGISGVSTVNTDGADSP
jgi:hypothetical protein